MFFGNAKHFMEEATCPGTLSKEGHGGICCADLSCGPLLPSSLQQSQGLSNGKRINHFIKCSEMFLSTLLMEARLSNSLHFFLNRHNRFSVVKLIKMKE